MNSGDERNAMRESNTHTKSERVRDIESDIYIRSDRERKKREKEIDRQTDRQTESEI